MTAAEQLAALAVSAARRAERFDDARAMALAALDRAPKDAVYMAGFEAGMQAVLDAQALQRAVLAVGGGRSVLRVIQGGT